jgi:hypothetical protein
MKPYYSHVPTCRYLRWKGTFAFYTAGHEWMNVEPCFSLVPPHGFLNSQIPEYLSSSVWRKILLFVEMQKIKYQISLFFREHFFVKENDDFFFEYFNSRNEIFKLISLSGRHVLKLTSSTRVGYILELKRCLGRGCLWNFSYICF